MEHRLLFGDMKEYCDDEIANHISSSQYWNSPNKLDKN